MSFLTTSLLAGSLLIALPIVLHLIMRRQPVPLPFPALRFVKKRKQTNQTRMQLQHWLLLALRCAAIALLAFALARPVLRGSGLKGIEGDSGLVAAALVFDNSPRMAYRHENQTRLEVAQELADWLLEQLPSDSQVGVLDRSTNSGRRLDDRDAATLRASRLTTTAATRPLGAAVLDALQALTDRPDDRREVYVFTDLAAAAWDTPTQQQIAAALDAQSGTVLYVVDVGVERPSNHGLGAVQLSTETLAAGQPITIRAPLVTSNESSDKPLTADPLTAELWIDSGIGPEKRAETILTDEKEIEFTLAALDAGVHQGSLRLPGGDPLPIDDTRYFTVEATPPQPLLVLANEPRDAVFVRQAIAPTVGGFAASNEIEVERFTNLGNVAIESFRGIMLIDPPSLDSSDWRRLADYAQQGGSVAIFLGPNAEREAYNSSAAQSLLPGPLRWRSRNETYLRPRNYQHPALDQMADFADEIPWSAFPVFQYWEFEAISSDAAIVADYANGDAALVERQLGDGRLLVMTTPVSGDANNKPWNLLPTGTDPWPFVVLMDNLANYLAGAGEMERNYAAGEPATIRVPPRLELSGYVLQPPTGDATRQPPPAGLGPIVIGVTDEVGNYRVRAGGQSAGLDDGFSVNAAADIGQLQRIEFAELQTNLGSERVQLAKGREELARQIDLGRVGRELYPWLICLMAIALGAEQWVANRFYRMS